MKRRILMTVLTVFSTLILMASMVLNVYAVTESDKKDLQEKIDQATNELDTISDNKDDAESELELLTNQVTEAQNELEALKVQLKELNESIDSKNEEIEEEEKEIERKDELLKQRMVALYEAGDTSFLDVLFNSESILDFFSSYSILQDIVESDTALINELEEKKAKLEQDKAELEENKEKVEEIKAEQEIKNAQLKTLQANKQAEIDKLSQEEQAKQAEIDSYNAAMIKVNQELEEAARKAQEAMNNASSSGNGSAGLNFDGSFIWPCDNKVVTSRMKYRWGRWHKGIDIGARYENVYASASGYAYNATNPGGYGTYIMIFHGDGYVTLYGHLDSSHIYDGQYVKQGQVIATSGNTGSSTGAHLHFEIRKATSFSNFFGNNWLDPLDYLPGGYTISE
ncbi:MAG: murein hydrolase activator EnvC family protein [Clostridia bacterium]